MILLNTVLIQREKNKIIICFNGKKLIEDKDKYEGLSDDEIKHMFLTERNIVNNRC